MKKLLSLLFVAFSFAGMQAEDVTLDFTAQGYANAADVTSLTVDGVTITLGTNGKNGPKYYTTGAAVRVYAGGTVEVAAERTITKAVFTYSEVYNNQVFNFSKHQNAVDAPETPEVSTGTLTETDTEGVWTGSANEFKITIPNTGNKNGHSRIAKVVVTVEGEATSISAPTFSPAGGTYYEAQSVEISAPEGATVYYTVDGSTPTAASTVYSQAITVDKDMTLKAIAVKGNLTSEVAEATYVISSVTTVDNIAAYAALGAGAYAAIANPVTVYYVNGNNVWVKDATGYMCIYGKVAAGMNYKNGDVIPGGFGGYLKEYNGGPEMTYNGSQDLFGFKAATAGEASTPEEITTAGVSMNNWGHLVVINKAKVSDVNGKNFNVTDAAGTVAGYNSFSLTLPTNLDAEYNITGIVGAYKDTKNNTTTVQLMATDFEQIIDVEDLPTVANIAALLATTDGANYKLANPVTVVAHSGQQLYIKDDSGFARVYGSLENTYKNGDVLTGIAGNVSVRNGMTQVNPLAATFGEAEEGTAVEPEEVMVEEIGAGDVHKYVKFVNATLAAVTKNDGTTDTRSITLTDENEDNILVYLNGFGVNYPESLEGNFDVTGFVVIYNTTLEIYPTEIKSLGGDEFEPGDVNGDGNVNGSDVTALYNYILNGEPVEGNPNVDGDAEGAVNGADVTALYNLLLK